MRIQSSLFAIVAAACVCASAQDQKAILDKLGAQYALTKTTADRTDIVTAGAILVLQKDNLLMVPVTTSSTCQNTYKDGKISQAGLSKLTAFGSRLSKLSKSANDTRTFVAGEKMWVTRVDVRDNGASFELFTDAYGDVRYKATLLIQFPKGPLPPADQVDRMVHEVFKVQPGEEARDNGQQAPAGGTQAAPAGAPAGPEKAPAPLPPPPPPPAEAAPAEIPPPPPPADSAPPQTIKLGQTPDQVVGILGPPQKMANLGKKQIYYYKDLKVTFTDNKVTDVQ